MTPAGWIAFVSGLITLVSTLTCGWLGVSAYLAGRRLIGAAILAAPLLFTLGLPVLLQALPMGNSEQAATLRFHLQLAGLVLTPLATVLALALSKRYLPH